MSVTVKLSFDPEEVPTLPETISMIGSILGREVVDQVPIFVQLFSDLYLKVLSIVSRT